MESIGSVPLQAYRVWEESSGSADRMAIVRSHHSGYRLIFQAAHPLAYAKRQVVADRDVSTIEQAIEGRRHTHAIGGVGATGLVHAPRDDVPGNKALNNRQAGNAAAVVVAAEHRVSKECLMQPLLDSRHLFGWSRGHPRL